MALYSPEFSSFQVPAEKCPFSYRRNVSEANSMSKNFINLFDFLSGKLKICISTLFLMGRFSRSELIEKSESDYCNLRISNEAFTLVCVPPANVCKVTAAVEEWLRSVSTSPAATVIINLPTLFLIQLY